MSDIWTHEDCSHYESHDKVQPTDVGERIIELRLCESRFTIPHPGLLYRFTVAPGCERCREDAESKCLALTHFD